MSSRSKRKGDQFERDVVAYLNANGFPYAERAYGAGRADDKGDVDGIPGIVIEVKNCKAFDLAGWVDEALRERATAGALFGIVIAKRPRRSAAEAYAVMPLERLALLLAALDEVESGSGVA